MHRFSRAFLTLVFAIDILFIVYFIFISDYRNDARQKENSSSKWVMKQWRQLVMINKALAQESVSECTLFRTGETGSFRKGDEEP